MGQNASNIKSCKNASSISHHKSSLGNRLDDIFDTNGYLQFCSSPLPNTPNEYSFSSTKMLVYDSASPSSKKRSIDADEIEHDNSDNEHENSQLSRKLDKVCIPSLSETYSSKNNIKRLSQFRTKKIKIETITLRPYQAQLLEKAKKNNIIAVLDTGTGKVSNEFHII